MTDAIKPESGEVRPITMQDVRLAAGEGKLSAHDVLNAVNAILRNRVQPVRMPTREAVARVLRAFPYEGRFDWLGQADRILARFHPGDTPEGQKRAAALSELAALDGETMDLSTQPLKGPRDE